MLSVLPGVSHLMMAFLKQLGAGCLAETDGPPSVPEVVVDATAHVKRERRKKVSAASSPRLSLPPACMHITASIPSPITMDGSTQLNSFHHMDACECGGCLLCTCTSGLFAAAPLRSVICQLNSRTNMHVAT
jgi:hypothetical protein